MTVHAPVVQALNTMITIELTVINQYFLHSTMCRHWGYGRLADRFRDLSIDEMKDAEAYAERVLEIGGLPNFQRINNFGVGETPTEQLTLTRDAEILALETLAAGIATAEEYKDFATAQMFRQASLEERAHLDWAETQLRLIERLGEVDYLTTQV